MGRRLRFEWDGEGATAPGGDGKEAVRGLARGEVLELRVLDVLLATLRVTDIDQSFFECEFAPEPAFSIFKPRFDRSAQRIDRGTDADMDEFEKLWNGMQAEGLTLIRVGTGEVVTDFILHIEGQVAHFRY